MKPFSGKADWSPDGQYIAFYSNHLFLDRTDLYVMQLGSAPYPVAQGSGQKPPWSVMDTGRQENRLCPGEQCFVQSNHERAHPQP